MIPIALALAAVLLQDAPVASQPPVRRRAPTEAELASSYRNEDTRAFVTRARAERFRVDSTLESYTARSYERISAGGSIGAIGRERPLARRESVGDVRWSRASGAFIEMKGQRRMRATSINIPSAVGDALVPIPWYPGMDALWLPTPDGPTGRGGRSVEADTTDLVHPLSVGSEAYYTFALGDSVSISLPGGRRVRLRELRARPRAPRWNLSVGSYWFDVDRAQMVRAIYRLSVPYDVWFETDNALAKGEKGPPWYVKAALQPLKAELQAVTVEYGLYENKFWMPRVRRVDGSVRAGPATMAVTIEQGFQYSDVNAVAAVPTIPAENLALRASADSLNAASAQLQRDRAALRTSADSAAWRSRRLALDTATARYNRRVVSQRAQDCKAGGVRYGTSSRLRDAVVTRIAVPCDSVKLANAPELQGGMLAERTAIYASTLDGVTRTALGLDEQAAFAPQRVSLHAGLEYLRYNRVEALSVGAAVRQTLGAGWSWEGNARGSFGDEQLNGELLAMRGNGGEQLTVGAYRRLVQADDYGFALGPVASLGNFLGGDDEQFYYRTAGAEAVLSRTGRGAGAFRSELRAFGEWQEGVGTKTRLSLPWLFDRSSSFDQNVIDTLPYQRGGVAGVALRLSASRGIEQEGWLVSSAVRVEAATGAFDYGRGAFDLSVHRALPASLRFTVALSGGTSIGTVPTHRWWNLGGWQTLRGQIAGSRRGDAFWMTRGELQWARAGWLQPGVFADAGWAGRRRALLDGESVLTSVGGAVGVLGLPIRIGAARPLAARGKWRVDLYAPIRF